MKKRLINEVIDMSYLNADLQKVNYRIDMKVNMEQSIFQRILDIISNSDLYKRQFFISSFQHNIYHIQRVMLFSQIIAQNECISEKDLKLLLLAAALHDSGKIRDRKDFEHGKNSAKIANRTRFNKQNCLDVDTLRTNTAKNELLIKFVKISCF